ncbi:MAG TPA: hypothetical protein VK463_09505 [Desulfomonilaceae bacterium]|nr:hypothetical protein [Desulfomonilaceae bacterium]
MKILGPLLLIAGLATAATVIFAIVDTLLPHWGGWIVYGIGGILILVAYLLRQAREEKLNQTRGSLRGMTVTDADEHGNQENLHQVRERIRRKKEKDGSNERFSRDS